MVSILIGGRSLQSCEIINNELKHNYMHQTTNNIKRSSGLFTGLLVKVLAKRTLCSFLLLILVKMCILQNTSGGHMWLLKFK